MCYKLTTLQSQIGSGKVERLSVSSLSTVIKRLPEQCEWRSAEGPSQIAGSLLALFQTTEKLGVFFTTWQQQFTANFWSIFFLKEQKQTINNNNKK